GEGIRIRKRIDPGGQTHFGSQNLPHYPLILFLVREVARQYQKWVIVSRTVPRVPYVLTWASIQIAWNKSGSRICVFQPGIHIMVTSFPSFGGLTGFLGKFCPGAFRK